MRVEKMFHIHLTEGEVKTAILDYLTTCGKLDSSYLQHILKNQWIVDFEDGEYVLVVNGAVKCNAKEPL